MKLSIIVVNWNTGPLLQQCLDSIAASSETLPHSDVEVIVVDNASTDGSQQAALESFPFAVQLIQNESNVGFARANNQAIRRAQGEYVLLLNPDTEVGAGALSRLIAFLDATPRAGAAGPRLLNPDGTLQISCYPAPTLFGEFFRLFHLDSLVPYGSYNMAKWRQDQEREVDALLGACLLIRGSVLERVGLLDGDYFMYSEEIDLCYRIRRAGWTLFWVPEAQVLHYGGQSTRLAATEMFLQLYNGKLLYFRKNHGTAAAALYKLLLALASVARLLVTPLALLQQPQNRSESFTLARRYSHLLQQLPSM